MITLEKAREIAYDVIEHEYKHETNEIMLLDDQTLETEFGWIFFYDYREAVEKKDLDLSMIGNAPILVEKATGDHRFAGTAHPIEYYIDLFRSNASFQEPRSSDLNVSDFIQQGEKEWED